MEEGETDLDARKEGLDGGGRCAQGTAGGSGSEA